MSQPFVGYTTVKVGTIPQSKLKRALAGNAVRLTNAELRGDRVMVVNRLNAKAIKKAQASGKGLQTHFTHDEAREDLEYHQHHGAGLEGGSLWSWLKNAGKAVYKFTKDNWSTIKPVVSAALDAGASAVPEAIPMRALVKTVSGVGLKKGSPEMKAKMAALRSKRKVGGSFRMP